MPTVIVSRPGIMQQSLRASLAACRGIVVVATSGDGLTALRQVALHHPDMLVIDSNLLDEEVEALLAAAKTEHSTIRCLVLTRSSQQRRQIWPGAPMRWPVVTSRPSSCNPGAGPVGEHAMQSSRPSEA